MVEGYDNVFVIGRCISADFKAQGALRIIPSYAFLWVKD